jgi:hypothetical protein
VRRYHFDEHYFDDIDTPEKAYWLGFIAGDGAIVDGALVIKLAARDSEHLATLTAALRSDVPIRQRTTIAAGKSYPSAVLHVTSWRLVEGLAAHGILPRKSLTLQPWDGPPDLMPHYWRGLVDADGSIGTAPHWGISLVGTESVTTAFGEWARGAEPALAARSLPHKSIWKFVISGRVSAQAVVRALYGDCSVALPRKAERAAALIASGPRKVERLAASLAGDRHGTTSGYRRGCRCGRCRAAHAVAAAAYKASRTSS